MGATPYADASGTGVTFRVWAPNATSIHVAGTFNSWNTNNTQLVRQVPTNEGIWSIDVPAARPGHQFKYSVNNTMRRRDPRARQVVHSGEAGAVIYDPKAYRWSTPEFLPPRLDQLVMYEMHIGTYGGTFVNAITNLDHVAALGVNAIQLMPVAEFAGNNSWGYNPSDPFSVESAYGGPDGFKTFVDACHERGLAVLLDVVHNHYGPSDLENSLWEFDGWSGASGGGVYFYQDAARHETKWGPRPDYSRPQVRQYIKDNIRMWLEEYRVDGFRWDATLYMRFTTNFATIADGELMLREVSDMMASEFPEKIHIAEDHVNDGKITQSLPDGLGFNSEWARSFHVTMTSQITNDAARDLEVIGELLTFTGGVRRLIYTESHDESGDHNEEDGAMRITTEVSSANPTGYVARKKSTLAAALLMTAPGIPMLFQGQEMLENELFSDLRPVDWVKTNSFRGIVNLHRDLSVMRRNYHGRTLGLSGDFTSASVTNNGTLLLVRRGYTNAPEHDVFIIANFSTNYVEGYWLDFPTNGTWYTHFNSDDASYSPDYGSWGSTNVFAWEDNRGNPYIAPWSVLVLSRYSPAWIDNDRDGMPNTWEETFGLNPNDVRDGWKNPDGDAYSNVEEFRAGTLPQIWNEPKSDFTAMSVAGDFDGWNPATNLMARIDDYIWQRDIPLTSSRIEFKFAANQQWNDNWGIVSQSVFRVPMTLSNSYYESNIILSNLTAGTYRFRFNERTKQFTIRPVGLADSDLDGLPDAWEMEHALDPVRSLDARSNPDGDLYDNQEEYLRDLDPNVWNAPLTDYNNMRVQGSFAATSPFMSQDPSNHYTWTFTTNFVQTTGLMFRIIANGDPAIRWALNGVNTFALPAAGTTISGGNFYIAVTQSFNGTYRFTFNELTRNFSVASADPDADGDGLPDWWELLYFGNSTNATPNGSPDGDVYSNMEEYRKIMNPSVWDSPRANYGSMAVPGTVNGWATAPNMNLVDHNTWRAVLVFTNATNPQFKFTANGNWNDNWGQELAVSLPMNGTATKGTPANMQINGLVDGFVVFTFNDATLQYSVAYDGANTAMNINNTAGPLVIQWNSLTGQVYRLSRGTNLNNAFTVIAPSLPATPPINSYTDAVQQAGAVFYQVLVNP
jgi:1,4-alpha-glucan branching enzyme